MPIISSGLFVLRILEVISVTIRSRSARRLVSSNKRAFSAESERGPPRPVQGQFDRESILCFAVLE